MEAVLYRYRAGMPWRDLPERFGDFRVVHMRLGRWSKTGVWQRVFEVLAEEADNEYAMIDSTIVRAHQHSAGLKGGMQTRKQLDVAKAGPAPKSMQWSMLWEIRSAFTSRQDLPVTQDGADVLLPDLRADTLLADKGYDADARVIDVLQAQTKTAVIPSKLNRTTKRDYDKDLYKARHLIENFFAKLKQYRALATRYDKLKVNFLGAIYLAATVIWLN